MSELNDLLAALEAHTEAGDFSLRLPLNGDSEAGRIAAHFNRMLDLAEKAVSRSDAIIRDIGDGIITFSEDGAITSLNPGAEKLFHAEETALLRLPITELFAADSHGGEMSLERMLTWGTRPEGATVWAIRTDQTRFPADIRVSRTATEEVPSYTALVKDISERKKAEEALRASRERMQRHSQALAALAAMLNAHNDDIEGLIAGISHAALDTLRVQSLTLWRQVPGTPMYQKLAEIFADGPPDANKYLPAFNLRPESELAQILKQERVAQVSDVRACERVVEIRDRYLVPRGVGAFLAAQFRLGGEPWGVVLFEHVRSRREWFPEEIVFAGSVADVFAMAYEGADRLRAEEEVRLINEELEKRVEQRTKAMRQSNAELQDALERIEKTQNHLVTVEKMAALGELVAGVAHEINTPVGVAVTGASFLLEQTRKVQEMFAGGLLKRSDFESYINLAGESSKMLMSNLERAAELVQSFKQVAVDQSSEDSRPFKVVEYTQEILLSLRPKLKKTRHEVIVEGPADLEIESYPGLFSQIITNMIVNSIMHAFEPHDAGRIVINYAVDSEDLVFTYTDNGKGIPEEILGRIFDPFFTTRRGRGGSGLGLHILYNIVSGRLGGTINCYSEVGTGTTFRMTLPIKGNQGSSHGL